MSRVDRAMRRAAEQAAAGFTGPHLHPMAGGIAVMETPEAFPGERDAGAELPAVPEDHHDLQPAAEPTAQPIVQAPPQSAAAQETRVAASHPGDATAAGPAGTPATDGRRASVFERMDVRLSEKVVVDERISGVSREQYRRLAATLHDAQESRRLRVIMVVSAAPSEGKTLTASNLALTFSESYQRRVLLVDADLRRPTLHTLFRLDTVSGLTDGLTQAGAKLVVRQVSDRLSVLPAGQPSADPMAGLTSERMRHLLEEARQAFDWVIVDTPPLAFLPDAHLLASMVDGAVMVIRAKATPHHLIKRALTAVGRTRVLGVVLNGAEPAAGLAAYGYGYGPGTNGETALDRT